MILFLDGYGNHINRLFQTIHVEAFCLEHHLKSKNLSIEDMNGLFPATETHEGKATASFYYLLKICRLIPTCIANGPEKIDSYKELLLYKRNMIVAGWGFRVPELTTKYQNIFIERYTLKGSIRNRHPEVIRFNNLRAENPTAWFIAVHIRRNDYRDWADGKYYFNDETYLAYLDQMDEIAIEITGTSPYFFIYSDERIELPQKRNHIVEQNIWYIDQYLMSKCDYIIGPPSTFSTWASYLGKTRFYHFSGTSDKIRLTDFRYCES